ncbi:MAG: HAMP domain-containing histidine kinase [Acidobacteria bacterium]|nr:HAMP domain-containing histidine kinase [Acidobacteriota bacterium]
MINRRRTEELKERNDLLLHRVIAEAHAMSDELKSKNDALLAANAQLRSEAEAKQEALQERDALQAELVEIARRVGLEELTTNILHNVSNTLNSVNVALSRVEQQIIASKISSIPQLAGLLAQNHDQLVWFLTQDERGKKVPEYLLRLSDLLQTEQKDIESEIEVMRKSVDHINQIVSYQQEYSKLVEFRETLNVCDLIQDAIAITQAELQRQHIVVCCDFEPVPEVSVDRRKLIQILLNLISNAKHSLMDCAPDHPEIRIAVALDNRDVLRISVADNGMGIPSEHMSRLFTFGFTTREEGHGFGLHGCANHAREMDGRIYAQSEGVNKGAQFILELPVKSEKP